MIFSETVISEMLSIRNSSVWQVTSSRIDVLRCLLSIVPVNNKVIVETMLNEADSSTDWQITAERVRMLYTAASRIKRPQAADVQSTINNLKNNEEFRHLQNNLVLLSAITLLQVMHNNIIKSSVSPSQAWADDDIDE